MENLTFLGAGNFTGTGNGSNNLITGGIGADTLSGGGGADTLIGGAGADTLTGGLGSDTFILAKGDANGDLITDFSRAQGDKISFTGYAPGALLVKTVRGFGGHADQLRRAGRGCHGRHLQTDRRHHFGRRHRLQVRLIRKTDMLTELYTWWKEQMRDLVPASLRQFGHTWKPTLVITADTINPTEVQLRLQGRSGQTSLGRHTLDAGLRKALGRVSNRLRREGGAAGSRRIVTGTAGCPAAFGGTGSAAGGCT